MKTLTAIFGLGALFFAVVGVTFGLLTHWEAVGSTALLLTSTLLGMIAAYLALLARRVDEQPSDDPDAEIEHGAGDQGVYSPWSWWPLVMAAAAATCFLGLAVGWWVLYIGVALGVVGLVGWVFEYSRGQHAH
jgi:hypothetical protein